MTQIAPLGYELLAFSCVDVSAEKFFRCAMSFYEGTKAKNWKVWNAPLRLEDIYVNSPPRGGAHYQKFVVWEPGCAPGKAVFLANVQDGWFTLVNVASKKLGADACVVRMGNRTTEPVFSFDLYRGGKEVRVLQLLRDDKWTFFSRGDVQPFEKPEYYRRRVADRLDRELILGYLRALGFDARDPAFWACEREAFYAERVRRDNDGE
ncbi:MAG: hypothetical protein ACTHN5_02870 [Phycisphaerae bacterium]